jgi:hypothetical protein
MPKRKSVVSEFSVSVRLRHSDKRMLVMLPPRRSVLELRLSPMPRRRLNV